MNQNLLKNLIGLLLAITLCFTHQSCAQNKNERFSIVCNQKYFSTLQTLILQAEKSISIIALSINIKNEKIITIVTALIAAKKRGVEVRVLCEGDHGWAAKLNGPAINLLRANGIKAQRDSENHLTHSKLVIIDASLVLIGSTNLTQNSLDKNNESNMLVSSIEAGQFYSEYFQNLWENPEKSWPMTRNSSSNSTTFFTDSAFLTMAGNLIDRSKKELNLVMYMIKMNPKDKKHPVTLLLDKMIKAQKRGVKVKLFLEQSYKGAFNEHIDKFNKDVKNYLTSQANIEVVFDRTDKITHSKILWSDNKEVLIASTNWYEKGIMSHHQTGICTTNLTAVEGMKLYFESLCSQQLATRINFPNGGDNPLPETTITTHPTTLSLICSWCHGTGYLVDESGTGYTSERCSCNTPVKPNKW